MTSADLRKPPCKGGMQPMAVELLIPRNGLSPICRRWAARYGRAQPVGLKPKEEIAMSKDGLCAIVTGSASGLGAATALILAKGGARIVVNYSSSQKEAEQTADLCRSAGADVVVVQGDVSRDEDCRKIV